MEFVTYWINHNKITQLHSIYEWTFRAIKYEHSALNMTVIYKKSRKRKDISVVREGGREMFERGESLFKN